MHKKKKISNEDGEDCFVYEASLEDIVRSGLPENNPFYYI